MLGVGFFPGLIERYVGLNQPDRDRIARRLLCIAWHDWQGARDKNYGCCNSKPRFAAVQNSVDNNAVRCRRQERQAVNSRPGDHLQCAGIRRERVTRKHPWKTRKEDRAQHFHGDPQGRSQE